MSDMPFTEANLLPRISRLEAENAVLLDTVDELESRLYKLDRTVCGLQNLLRKAGEYEGREKGRLPRDRK